MIISIDSGNRNIKTENFVFPTSLSESDFDLGGLGKDIMKYNGKYYSLDGKRIRYLRDKTIDERFFILALFGIAKEIEKKINDGKIADSDKISTTVTLLNGLPPKHFANAEKFKQYFITKEPVVFTFNGRSYRININEAEIFPQAFAIAALMKKKVYEADELLIVDLGGRTLDYMVLSNGRYNMSECESLDSGIIDFYNEVLNFCNSKFDIKFKESQIDAILKGTYKLPVDDEVKEYICNAATNYCNEIVNTLKEEVEGFRAMPIVFAGGGSVILQKYFKSNPLLVHAEYVDDVCANAKGYKALYKITKRRSKK